MKKRILAVGDSWTFGDELEKFYDAWPYVLANLIDADVYNMGQSGCSNTSILRRTLVEIPRDPSNPYDMVFIGWTSPGRTEWKDEIGREYALWPGYSLSAGLFKDHPWRQDYLNYINRYHNVEYLYQQYLVNVISLQSYFKEKNIPYVMINVMSNNDYYQKTSLPNSSEFADQIDKDNFLGWNTFGMKDLTDSCPKGPGGHPLTKGHQAIAAKIYEHIRHLGWLS
jgi:hypothetical protein